MMQPRGRRSHASEVRQPLADRRRRPDIIRRLAVLPTSTAVPMTHKRLYTSLTLSVANRIATITLDRPTRLNAIDDAMPGEIRAAVEAAEADDIHAKISVFFKKLIA